MALLIEGTTFFHYEPIPGAPELVIIIAKMVRTENQPNTAHEIKAKPTAKKFLRRISRKTAIKQIIETNNNVIAKNTFVFLLMYQLHSSVWEIYIFPNKSAKRFPVRLTLYIEHFTTDCLVSYKKFCQIND